MMKIYGLIGKSLQHSFSPCFFNNKFSRENFTDCCYQLFPIENAGEIRTLVAVNTEIAGLNVTIPYKQAVMKYLDYIDPTAQQIGAVNTIKITREKNLTRLFGYNTDAHGFLYSNAALKNRPKTMILGTGGSAQAVRYILKQWQIPFISVSRNPGSKNEIGYLDLNETIIKNHLIIINTTPLGMFPHIDESPLLPYQYLTKSHFLYDLIYNPTETMFLKNAVSAGANTQNGELMLELQAERSWEIWNL